MAATKTATTKTENFKTLKTHFEKENVKLQKQLNAQKIKKADKQLKQFEKNFNEFNSSLKALFDSEHLVRKGIKGKIEFESYTKNGVTKLLSKVDITIPEKL